MDSITKLWPHLITLATGGILWEGVKFFFPEISRRIKVYKEARQQLHENIDPILKSADELYGKLFSLANEDFSSFTNTKHSIADDPLLNREYVYFLVCQFLSHLEFIRMKSQYYSISKTKKGKELLRFIDTYESRGFRLLDRSIQRMIGEGLIQNSAQPFKIMSLHQFYNAIHNKESKIIIWVQKLEKLFCATNDKENRQRILVFGVIVAALIDHFDPNNKIVRKREIYINKLSEKSKQSIQGKLLNAHLPFLKNKEKYFKKKGT